MSRVTHSEPGLPMVLVPSLVRSSAVVNFHFFCVSQVGKRFELALFLVFLNLKLFAG